MQEYTLPRTGRRPVKFTGELLASAATSPDNGHPDYSGTPGRWCEGRVYRTDKDTWVLEVVRQTRWANEEDIHLVHVAESLDVIVDLLEDRFVLEEQCIDRRVAHGLINALAAQFDIAERL